MSDGETILIPKVKVVLLSICVGMAYGILHDQITARLCIEYFTVAHPPLIDSESPTLLGLAWGVAGTFGVSLLLGILLAQVSQSRGLPPMPIASLCKPLFVLLATMAVGAVIAGWIGFELSRRSIILLGHNWKRLIPPSHLDRFLAVSFAHVASYAISLGGGVFLIVRIWNQRHRPGTITLLPRTRTDLIRAMLILVLLVVIIWLRFFRAAR